MIYKDDTLYRELLQILKACMEKPHCPVCGNDTRKRHDCTGMKTMYNYVIFRYIHDIVTEEFVNIGVVILVPSENYIESKFITKLE